MVAVNLPSRILDRKIKKFGVIFLLKMHFGASCVRIFPASARPWLRPPRVLKQSTKKVTDTCRRGAPQGRRTGYPGGLAATTTARSSFHHAPSVSEIRRCVFYDRSVRPAGRTSRERARRGSPTTMTDCGAISTDHHSPSFDLVVRN